MVYADVDGRVGWVFETLPYSGSGNRREGFMRAFFLCHCMIKRVASFYDQLFRNSED